MRQSFNSACVRSLTACRMAQCDAVATWMPRCSVAVYRLCVILITGRISSVGLLFELPRHPVICDKTLRTTVMVWVEGNCQGNEVIHKVGFCHHMESTNPCVDEGCAGYGLWKLARSLYTPCRRILVFMLQQAASLWESRQRMSSAQRNVRDRSINITCNDVCSILR